MNGWFTVANFNEVATPALLIYPDRVEENIRRMIAVAGGVDHLRPHMKTHKLAEVIQIQLDQGITRFKCATIAEAEMTVTAGAPDVLLAYQPVGPNVSRLIELIRVFPKARFSVIADDANAIRALSSGVTTGSAVFNQPIEVEVLLDIDVGQHRTGVEVGPGAATLYRAITTSPGLKPGGLHAYDGHIHDSDLATRVGKCDEAFAPVAAFRQELIAAGLPVPRVVAGGTPTFPMHAKREDVECSPGTCVLWDAGYATHFPDLDFLPAAVLLARVVGKPGANRLCLDLGHKAVASEMPQPRAQFLNLPQATIVAHNEEHMVVEAPNAAEVTIGDCLYALPWHVCPTVALHSEVVVVRASRSTERWQVRARARKLTI